MTVYDEIENERMYQNGKWGTTSDDTKNTPWMWLAYICQYASKWMRGKFELDTNDTDEFRLAMIKTAATAVAAVESIDRQREQNGGTFYEA